MCCKIDSILPSQTMYVEDLVEHMLEAEKHI